MSALENIGNAAGKYAIGALQGAASNALSTIAANLQRVGAGNVAEADKIAISLRGSISPPPLTGARSILTGAGIFIVAAIALYFIIRKR